MALQLTQRGYLETDARYQTSSRCLYAGDIIGPPLFAHVASYEAVQAVEGMFTNHAPKKVSVFPSCTYCQPQVASVGLTERAAKEKGFEVQSRQIPIFRERQSPGGRRGGRLCENYFWRAAW